MPIITVQFIKDVVATPEQKRELVVRLTDTFVDILGEVVRPFVYCLIHETPQSEWAIAGVPMPDLAYLTSDKHAGVIARSNELMRQAIASSQAQPAASNTQTAVAPATANLEADRLWRGESDYGSTNFSQAQAPPAQAAETQWRGQSRVAERHRALFERWFDELWNKKNYDIAYELVDPGFIAHGAGGQDIKQGPDGVIEMVKAWHRAMPDGRMTMDDIITEGNLSTLRMTWRGTHTGPFGERPASGNPIIVTSIGIDRVVNGKITEGWGELDMLGMLRQMSAQQATPEPDGQATTPNASQLLRDPARLARNRQVVHRFHEAINSTQHALLDEFLAPGFVAHGGPDGDTAGVRAFSDSLEALQRTVPDQRITEDHVIAEGDRVATRVSIVGSHLGSYAGETPTGKHLRWTALYIYRLDEKGRIAELWQDVDRLGLYQQLGLLATQEGSGQASQLAA
ncbi:MAG TPA: ester cyclase [Trueperaceae bacterium]